LLEQRERFLKIGPMAIVESDERGMFG